MVTFTATRPEYVVECIIPLTQQMMNEAMEMLRKSDDSMVSVAIYYLTGKVSKPKRESMVIVLHEYTVALDDPLIYVNTGEYHPRKDGKADLVFTSPVHVRPIPED